MLEGAYTCGLRIMAQTRHSAKQSAAALRAGPCEPATSHPLQMELSSWVIRAGSGPSRLRGMWAMNGNTAGYDTSADP